jgi:hypothetical protein
MGIVTMILIIKIYNLFVFAFFNSIKALLKMSAFSVAVPSSSLFENTIL